MSDFPVTIWHNPGCGTSRNVLAMIRAAGYVPVVVDYLKEGWSEALLRRLMAAMGVGPMAILRESGTPAAELGLLEAGVTEEALIAAMLEHPILVNRPIVETPRGVRLCRPSEAVLELLDRKPEQFVKEDGQVVVPK